MNTDAPTLFRPPPNASRVQQREWDEQMQVWLQNQLNEEINRNLLRVQPRTWEYMCIMRARAGNPESLRTLYPQFADCIFSPKRGRGEKYPKPWKSDFIRSAKELTRFIRALWLKQYGQQNRTRDEKSAEEFAVDILKKWFPNDAASLTVGKVLASKPSGKRKVRRK
jgi:hypothetical protein